MGVSADGSVVVGGGNVPDGSPSATSIQAFRWTSGGGMIGLDQSNPVDDDLAFSGSEGSATSADGSVIVGAGLRFGRVESFRWTSSEGMVALVATGPAIAVSADGSVVVGGDDRAFRWTSDGGMVFLTHGVFSQAWDVSSDGSIVVGFATGLGAFRWTAESGMVGLGHAGVASAVSADGAVIAGYRLSGGAGSPAFLWDTANGARELDQVLMDLGLDLTGWSLTEVHGLSDDGLTLAGTGINPDGNEEARVAVIPEPTSGALLGLGLVGLVLLRCRRC